MDSYLALEKMLLLLCADLAIIIGAARISGWLFGKLGQPPVVGEILAGVILGPSLLGRLYPGAISTHAARPRPPAYCRRWPRWGSCS